MERGFCGECGTSLTYRHRDQAGEIDVTLATLDEPGEVAPECHIWVSDKLAWVELGDGLPQVAMDASRDCGGKLIDPGRCKLALIRH